MQGHMSRFRMHGPYLPFVPPFPLNVLHSQLGLPLHTCRAVTHPGVVVAVPNLVAVVGARFGPPGRRLEGEGGLDLELAAPVTPGQAALAGDLSPDL